MPGDVAAKSVRFAQISAAMRAANTGASRYNDSARRFSLEIPRGWTQNKLLPAFSASGGCLALSSRSQRASFNVSAGPLERPELRRKEHRAIELRRTLAQYADIEVLDNTEFADESNVVIASWGERDGSRSGLTTAVHNDLEYVIEYKRDEQDKYEIDHLLFSFCFLE